MGMRKWICTRSGRLIRVARVSARICVGVVGGKFARILRGSLSMCF